MHIQVQLVLIADDGTEHHHVVANLDRTEPTLATLGLNLAESKALLAQLQAALIGQQVTDYLAAQRPCAVCGKLRPLKAHAVAPFRTLFGIVDVPNPRWEHCACQSHESKTIRPLAQLLPERTSPELRYLETKWAALLPYGVTAHVLHDVLPLDPAYSAVTIRNHLLQAAQRQEQELGSEQALFIDGCQATGAQLPLPDGPLAVGLDGAIVRARRGSAGTGPGNLFEVITGKSICSFRRDDPDEVPPSSKCFALVQGYDTKPKRRLYELLRSQGMQANQAVTFFSDGGETVQRLQEYLNPDSEHILDWFHLTMKLTVLQQCARGLTMRPSRHVPEPSIERQVESTKHYLWHGNTVSALETLETIADQLASWEYDDDGHPKRQSGSESAIRMRKYVDDLATYVRRN